MDLHDLRHEPAPFRLRPWPRRTALPASGACLLVQSSIAYIVQATDPAADCGPTVSALVHEAVQDSDFLANAPQPDARALDRIRPRSSLPTSPPASNAQGAVAIAARAAECTRLRTLGDLSRHGKAPPSSTRGCMDTVAIWRATHHAARTGAQHVAADGDLTVMLQCGGL